MLKLTFLTAVLLASATSALAQQQPPGAGGQLRQIPPASVPPRATPEMRVDTPQPTPSQAGDSATIRVDTLRVSGATLFPEAELVMAAQAPLGRDATLGELRAAAQRISAYYSAHGYFVAQAYLPAQDITAGSVTIAVVEGRYDKVLLRNGTKVADRIAGGILSGLDTGDMVANKPLERRLLLLSDLPGVAVRSTLTPGAAVGATDLIVDLSPARPIDGVIEADNAGNRYTGAYRAGGTLNFNEPLGLGDVASVRVLASDGGFYYGRASYEMQVEKGRVGVAYAALRYKLGREFKALDASGDASIATLYGSYPLIRGYGANLHALASVEAKSFRDEVGATSSAVDRSARVVNLGLSGDHAGGGGWTYYAANLGLGDLDIETPAARAIDAATARTNGRYNKLSFDLARLQTLSGPLSLYVAIGGQVASKNLDPSEKMELGGAYGVRAYPEGEAYGDQGYLANAEARYLLTQVSAQIPGDLQLVAFVDAGRITSNKNNWAGGPNHRTLSGAGVGAIWTANNSFMVKASYARKLGDQVPTSAPDRSGRFWIQVSKFF